MNQEKQPPSDWDRLNAVIDEHVRPALRQDGGDLKILSYKNNVLTIHYQGACHGCPHAAMGTLMAIQNVLQEKFHPDIVVKMG